MSRYPKKPPAEPVVLPPFDPRLRYRIEEAAAFLRQSRATTFNEIEKGALRVIRTGNRTWVPGSEIERLCRLDNSAA